jgi:1-acyl-sn-glycerol-3-phosphate acyltransferase
VGALSYSATRFLCRALFAPVVKTRVLRPEVTRRQEAWILASNHISHFDPPLIGVAAQRKIDWMGMLELFRIPVLGAWLRAIDTFPVDRENLDRQSVRTSLERLRAGRAVGIFPEGGIRDGARSAIEGAPLRPGVASLAQMTDAPVIPCVIMGSDRLYALKDLWRPGHRLPVWIGFGEPLVTPQGLDRAAARAALEIQLGEAFQKLASEMRQHFGLCEDDLPQSPIRRREEAAAVRRASQNRAS